MKNSFTPTDAVARYYARHAKADDAQHNAAAFTWNEKLAAFEIEVRGMIVATFAKLSDVRAFSVMHNTTRIA